MYIVLFSLGNIGVDVYDHNITSCREASLSVGRTGMSCEQSLLYSVVVRDRRERQCIQVKPKGTGTVV